jgi:hypothetical protein
MVAAASNWVGSLPRRIAVVLTGVVIATWCTACSKSEAPSASDTAQPSDTAVPSDTAQPSDTAPCDGDSSSESPFEPPDVAVVPVGANVTMKVVAATLREAGGAFDFYAVLHSEGEYPMCSPALQVDFFDHDDQLLGTTSGAVWTGRVFRFEGSVAPVACVAPGQVAAGVVQGFVAPWSLKDVKYVEYRLHAFGIDTAEEQRGAVVGELQSFETHDGVTFRGTLTNSSDTAISEPRVTVLPLDCGGRPLGLATAVATLEIPPNGTWTFDSSVVQHAGARQLVFGVGNFAPSP